MKAPQIVYICIMALSLGMTASRHGEPKKGNESFFISLIAVAIQTAILLWGGFFN